MESKIQEMMNRYPTKTINDKENSLKEVSQEIILYGLSHTDFFAHASMYGGTAMRLFLGVDRFSEDLDFLMKKEDNGFSWESYSPSIKKALESFGLSSEIVFKNKSVETGVTSAFVSEPTKEVMLSIFPKDDEVAKIVFNQRTKIKFEVDSTPILSAKYQTGYLEYPTSFGISILDKPSLFSGKICALLFRSWKSRSKGRDFYDFAFYVRKGVVPNLAYLQEVIMKKEPGSAIPTSQDIIDRLKRRFLETDFEEAKDDVVRFVPDSSRLNVWNKDYFLQLADKVFNP
jgi:hypothetical protein